MTLDLIEKWKQEILETENEFSKMAEEKGIRDAFVHFANDEAVLLRNNKLIKGKNSLYNFYNNLNPNQKLKWKPDFVDVALSGELGYTYGKYTLSSTDLEGKTITSEGIFHTVWKKQPDGNWRFVWD